MILADRNWKMPAPPCPLCLNPSPTYVALRRAEMNDWLGQQQQAIYVCFILEGSGFKVWSFGFRVLRTTGARIVKTTPI